MPNIVLATTQSKVYHSVERNGIEIRRLIRKSKSQGADIVHFCEGALSGYAENQLRQHQDIDFTRIRIEIEKIKLLCRELNIWTVLGSAHELSNGNKPHNSLYIISDKGEIFNRYDKRKCSNNELSNWYTPGFDPCYFEVKGVKFCCIICIEIQFPELFIQAEKEEVHCILFSSYSKDEMFGIQAQGYAATHSYWISMSIPANESEKLPGQLIMPDGHIQARCRRNQSTLIVKQIDTEHERWHVPLNIAKPWRRLAKKGEIYSARRVMDTRSEMKTIC